MWIVPGFSIEFSLSLFLALQKVGKQKIKLVSSLDVMNMEKLSQKLAIVFLLKFHQSQYQ